MRGSDLARAINPARLPKSRGLSPVTAISALAYMLDWADGDGCFYAPRNRLMAVFDLSDTSIKRIMRYWVRTGAIRSTGRRRTANQYSEYQYCMNTLLSWSHDARLFPQPMRRVIENAQALRQREEGGNQAATGEGRMVPTKDGRMVPPRDRGKEREEERENPPKPPKGGAASAIFDSLTETERMDGTPYAEIVELYQQMLPNWRQMRALTKKRRKLIRDRWADMPDLAKWRRAFDAAGALKFFQRETARGDIPTDDHHDWESVKSWCSLEWLLHEDHFVKHREAVYSWAGFWRALRYDADGNLKEGTTDE